MGAPLILFLQIIFIIIQAVTAVKHSVTAAVGPRSRWSDAASGGHSGQSGLSRQRAGGAQAEDLERVTDVRKAMTGREVFCPSLHRRALDLDGRAAFPAHQMMVVTGTATAAIQLFPIRQPHLVDLIRFRQQLQRAVDRRQPDRDPAVPQSGMKLLSAAELLGSGQQGENLGALPCVPFHAGFSLGHQISPPAVSPARPRSGLVVITSYQVVTRSAAGRSAPVRVPSEWTGSGRNINPSVHTTASYSEGCRVTQSSTSADRKVT